MPSSLLDARTLWLLTEPASLYVQMNDVKVALDDCNGDGA